MAGWAQLRKDTLQPLATVLKVGVSDLTREFRLLCPTVLQLWKNLGIMSKYFPCSTHCLAAIRNGLRDMDKIWARASNHWGRKTPVIGQAAPNSVCSSWVSGPGEFLCPSEVAFMLSVWTATSELEQNFAFLQMFSSGRKKSTTVRHLLSPSKQTGIGLPGTFVATSRRAEAPHEESCRRSGA